MPPADPDAPLAKAPPPGLSMRAARPPVVRLRRSVVQGLVITGAVLVSGSLAWAFVIQPDLREQARTRAVAEREEAATGAVRPSEAVTDQPASYDRLPEPRGLGTEPSPDTEPTDDRSDAYAYDVPPPYREPQARATQNGPRPGELAARSALFFETGQGASGRTANEASPMTSQTRPVRQTPDFYNPNALVGPVSPFELKAGAMVPAVLLTAVDTARSGPVVATVTQNVFDSVTGRHLLLPQGTRLIGSHEGESAYGDRRAFLAWERIILPNGKSLVLDAEPGVDAQGAIGVRGEVDRRLFPLLVGTLFAGAITTLGQVARDDAGGSSGGLLVDAGDAAAIEGAQVGGRLVDRELEVRPSIRLRPGVAVRVLITRDLILEPYRS